MCELPVRQNRHSGPLHCSHGERDSYCGAFDKSDGTVVFQLLQFTIKEFQYFWISDRYGDGHDSMPEYEVGNEFSNKYNDKASDPYKEQDVKYV